MNNYKKFIFLNILLMLYSCGTIKEGFTNQKKNSSDEFLVEKKLPLVMPPSYGELSLPSSEKTNKENQINNIESLLSKKKDNENLENVESDKNFEESILKKIKNN
ncbi:DUF3035 domain-containing protein [Candidatus Pelagibacter bacterium]|jgi:hypothetical protein|nr:DUF3035 domain-containing protein [Candidatus Pelagibacter bacterium]